MAREYFNAYHSYIEAMEPLNDAEKGRLFMACLKYSMSGEVPQLNGNERFVFHSLKSQIDRDSKKYEARCEKNRENVLQRYTIVDERIREPTKSTKEKEKEKEKEKYNPAEPDCVREIITHLNLSAKTRYRPEAKATRRHVIARLNEGFTLNDFIAVIDKKCADWLDTDMAKYLRPETLFSTKFESYLNQPSNAKATPSKRKFVKTGEDDVGCDVGYWEEIT